MLRNLQCVFSTNPPQVLLLQPFEETALCHFETFPLCRDHFYWLKRAICCQLTTLT